MENLHIHLLFVPTFILLLCSMSFVSSFSQLKIAPNQCLDDQRSALVELQLGLYHSQNFSFSSKADLWDLNTDCCTWKGVMCDGLGHVIGLHLNYKNLSGTFHPIFNLHHLQKLNLAGNSFNTTLFSSQFDRLPNLTHLNLSDSCFHGQVPVGISYLTRLVSLDLSSQDSCYWRNDQTLDYYYDQTDGHSLRLDKPSLETIIKNMKSLRELHLDGVNISTQSSEWCETISLRLPKLRMLSLSSCGLTGPFCSSLLRFQFLSKLNLNDNPISYLPSNFLEISSPLVSLSLVNCNLSGHFPTQVFLSPQIKSIQLSQNYQLMGRLPEFSSNSNLEVLWLSGTNFSGKLPETIGNLRFLIDLTLSDCNFSGPIPSSLANLTNLVTLDLLGNSFSGPIPPFHRYGVPKLSYLSLASNRLSGHLSSSIFTLPSLQSLNLRGNQLVGEIDEFKNASSSLIELVNLSYNYFRGSIPKSIFHLPMLEGLFIGYNSLDSMKLDMFSQINNLRALDLSNISLSIGSNNNKSLIFPQLQSLSLRSCNLTEFPEFIKTQERLAVLDLSENRLHGFVPNWLWKSTLSTLRLSSNEIDLPKQIPFADINSSFPEFLKSQERLYLDLSNNQIRGTLPNWVWEKSLWYLDLSHNNLTYLDQFSANQSITYPNGSSPTRPICNLSQLEYFDASYNNLSGPIPNCLGNITTLQFLDLQGNHLTGNLPNFAEEAQLGILNVNGNRLQGKLPRSLANCTQLTILDVGKNMMHDALPSWLGKLPALDVLDITSNNFFGQLSIDFLQASQLRSLKISGNKLEGKLPRSLSNCPKLEVLDLGNNMFHDTFPYWLHKLPSLKVLVLRANGFHGAIKISGSTENGFPMLRILDIASNNFSGELPIQFFHSLRGMMRITDGDKAKADFIREYYYQDSVAIVNKGREMVYFQKILTILTCLDVSNNSFHGRIPEDIKYLKSLKVLNFSHNSFSGTIPLALENLTELESLDLSQNILSGRIPPQLTSLTFLSVLNLSCNQLEGSIPLGKQFNTFSNDSYQGNPRLCGPPLTRKCDEGVPSTTPPPREDVDSWVDGISVWKIALIGYGGGLVVGLCVGYTVLNEWGNKWLRRFERKGRRTRRRS